MTQAQAQSQNAPSLSLVGEFSIPNLDRGLSLSYDDLIEMCHKHKVIQKWQLIYLGLLHDYGHVNVSGLQVADFCDRWFVEDTDLKDAILKLEKKKLCRNKVGQLSLELYPESLK